VAGSLQLQTILFVLAIRIAQRANIICILIEKERERERAKTSVMEFCLLSLHSCCV
jgi:hypothetical protein